VVTPHQASAFVTRVLAVLALRDAGSRGWYDPHWHYQNEEETRAALDLIFSDHLSRNEPGVFAPLRDTLLIQGDHYMHLADLRAYLEADQRVLSLYADPPEWAGKPILNVAASGRFSSDRTIREYATEIWGARPCPVTSRKAGPGRPGLRVAFSAPAATADRRSVAHLEPRARVP